MGYATIPTVRTFSHRSSKSGDGSWYTTDDEAANNQLFEKFSCVHPLSLAWKDLSVTVNGGRHVVLNKVTAHAEPGRLLAVMGPSGCGKTTLLETLSGRHRQDGKERGQILVNGRRGKLAFGKTAAYVTQDDTLIGSLTVFETIWYSACLRFPNKMEVQEKLQQVEMAILEMGLHEARNTRVGTWGVKGLSGGEKRRLSIAVEILTRPSVLFLDEPTSGLDSAAAYFVVQRLRDLAREGHTVVAVVHQPSSEVYQLFQDLLLLSSGRVVYFGQVSRASEFFAMAGYPCPPQQNPADHYLRCINKDFESVRRNSIAIERAKMCQAQGNQVADTSFDEEAQNLRGSMDPDNPTVTDTVEKLISTYQASELAARTDRFINKYSQIAKELPQSELPEDVVVRPGSTFERQLFYLTKRSFTNMRRDWSYYWVRLLMYIALAIFIGYVFFNESFDYQSIAGRGMCLCFVVGFLTFMSIGGFPCFIEDMKVFTRERRNGHYGVTAFVLANLFSSCLFLLLIAMVSSSISYFMANLHSGFTHYAFYAAIVFASLLAVESLMMAVAAVVPNFLMGIVVGASIMATLLLVSGFYRLPDQLPIALTKYPLFYSNFFMYALQGSFKNEFTGLTFSAEKPGGAPITGTYILKTTYEMDVGRSKWFDLLILSSNVLWYRIIFFVVIKARENIKFQMPRFRKQYAVLNTTVQPEVKPLDSHM